MVLTVRRAFPATSELGTPTPKVFSMLTTSSRASIESSPRPFGPNSGRSSPIWSGVVGSIKFLTSISLMRARRSASDIVGGAENVVISALGQRGNWRGALFWDTAELVSSKIKPDRPYRREQPLDLD